MRLTGLLPALLLAALAAGCGGRSGPLYEVVPVEMLPARLAAWVAPEEAGVRQERVGNHLYLMLVADVQPTGGYVVRVDEVAVTGAQIQVAATLLPPAPGQPVTEAFTYPRAYIRLRHPPTWRAPAVAVRWQQEPAPAASPPPGGPGGQGGPQAPPGIPPGSDLRRVRFDRLSLSMLPPELDEWRDWHPPEPAARGLMVDGYHFMAVSAGPRPTGGYQVEVVEVWRGRSEVVLVAVLKQPAEGQAVTAAITYPVAYLRIFADRLLVPPVRVIWRAV